MRQIILIDGTGMDGTTCVFQTNAPVETLKELEKISCDAYITGGGAEDVPIWSKEVSKKGYEFTYVDEYPNVSPFGTADEWQKQKYPHVTEVYTIENQPETICSYEACLTCNIKDCLTGQTAREKGKDAYDKFVEEIGKAEIISSIENMTSSEIFVALSETQKDELYRMLWSDHVYEDVKARLSENPDLALDEEEEEALCEDIVNAYVYNGDYDCNLSYWDNIDNLIQEYGGK